jgi:N-acetylmuramoyl-L-alanine amidase
MYWLMDKTRETKISLYVTLVLFAIVVIFMFVASFITSVGYNSYQTALIYNTAEAFEQTTAQKDRFTIVLDAGHGGEDPGAVANGAVEKDINLSIAKKLKDFLELTGVNVVLTRDKDVLLYTQEQAKSKKMYDLKNRLAFAEGFENALFVSIHMNKFTAERYFGPQTFYSENDARSLMLAESIQRATKLFSPDNTRVVKPENGTIYILENIKKPAVLVECGFLSNEREAYLLQQEAYQNAVAFSLFKGITDYLVESETNT